METDDLPDPGNRVWTYQANAEEPVENLTSQHITLSVLLGSLEIMERTFVFTMQNLAKPINAQWPTTNTVAGLPISYLG